MAIHSMLPICRFLHRNAIKHFYPRSFGSGRQKCKTGQECIFSNFLCVSVFECFHFLVRQACNISRRGSRNDTAQRTVRPAQLPKQIRTTSYDGRRTRLTWSELGARPAANKRFDDKARRAKHKPSHPRAPLIYLSVSSFS